MILGLGLFLAQAASNGVEGRREEVVEGMIVLVMIFTLGIVSVLLSIGFRIWLCYSLRRLMQRVPVHLRQCAPGQAWLLMIPLFSYYWYFRYLPLVCDSYSATCEAIGLYDQGDCGRGLARGVAVVNVLKIVIGIPGSIAATIMAIMLVVKLNKLQDIVITGTALDPYRSPSGHSG